MGNLCETFLYQAVGFLLQTAPPAYVLFHLFRGEFRFPAGRTWRWLGLLLGSLALFFSFCVIAGYTAGCAMLYLYSNLIFAICVLICFLFFMYMIRDDGKKKLFAFLLALNYACLVLWLTNILLYQVPDYQKLAIEFPYGTCTNVLLFFTTAMTAPVFYRLFYRKSFPDLKNVPSRVWTLCLILQSTYFLVEGIVVVIGVFFVKQQEGLLWFLVLLFLIEIIVYRVVFYMLQLYEEKFQIENRLRMQEQQYGHLKESMELVRRTKHDLEHHFAIMRELGRKEETAEKLRSYVEEYLSSGKGQEMEFCENYAMNALFNYYAQLARDRGISIQFRVDLPEALPFQETALGVLFGNALKNALEECSAYAGKEERPWIQVSARFCQKALILCVENVCQGGVPVKEKEGWSSTRHPGCGMGLTSIRDIAEKYRGTMEIEVKGGVFLLKVLLYAPGNA